MNNSISNLEKKYNILIRKKCSRYERELDECMRNQFNDCFVCKVYDSQFTKCTKDFDIEFKRKHSSLFHYFFT